MGRSGYSEDYDGDENYPNATALYQANIERSLRGKKGQAFLRELAAAMDAMPERRLIAEELVDEGGECCTMGVVFKARGIPTDDIEPHEADTVAEKLGIKEGVAREIAFQNDDDFNYVGKDETPEQRWLRMRAWVDERIKKEAVA